MYVYAARAIRVVDGDTIDLDVNIGFSIHTEQRIRLLGINCPEHGSPEGEAATAYTAAWLAEHGRDLILRTVLDKKEKYGRLLGIVVSGTRTLNDDLVAAGHAVAYDGGRRSLPGQRGNPPALDPYSDH